jgi:ferrochelatase
MSDTANHDTPAILLLAHGTPDRLSEMAAYLDKVTSGRPMSPAIIAELQHRYAEIGLREEPLPEGPPLTKWTLLQGRLLSEALGRPVYIGMRNWHPFIADVVEQMKSDGIKKARVLCLAPQNSRTSVGLYRRALMQAVAGAFPPEAPMQVEFIAGWADESLLAQAFAEKLWPVWAEACAVTSAAAGKPVRVPVLFTAHAVPCRTIISAPAQPTDSAAQPGAPVPADGIQNYGPATQPDPYPVECKHTATRIAEQMGALGMTDRDWFFAFQSQGIAGAPWLGPTVPDTLKNLAQMGHKAIVLQPVGFLCDHVEILYDIDVDFKKQAADLGMTLYRADSLNDSPTLIRAIEQALQREPTPETPGEAPARRPTPKPVAAEPATPEAVAAR